jgi:hypothetical protein
VIKINVKEIHVWIKKVFLLFLSPFDAFLVVSLQEWFATKFCPSPIKSYVSFYHVLCYIDVRTNWKSSSIVSTNNNVYWVTVTPLFLFQWYIILEWLQEKKERWLRPLFPTEKDKRAGVERRISFRDMDRLCRKGLFKHKWFNGK